MRLIDQHIKNGKTKEDIEQLKQLVTALDIIVKNDYCDKTIKSDIVKMDKHIAIGWIKYITGWSLKKSTNWYKKYVE